MARPTNRVLVIVGAASGCWAIAVKAEDTDLPSLKAGNIQPMPVVIPEITIDATATSVVLSIIYVFLFASLLSCIAAVIYTVANMLKM